MHKRIIIEEAQKLSNPLYIDMRSPAEFSIGHIHNAINIPLFSDEERAEVGTLYKKVGVEQATELGLAIASKKLPEIVAAIKTLSKTGRPVIVYCWRGGMRSTSIVTILNLLGIGVSQLIGGYKAYRRFILDSLLTYKIDSKIILLCGSTGVGKTRILELLEEKNIPVINLEKLANHRGSVFGQVGLGKAVTAQSFDEAILMALYSFNTEPYIVLECESKRIGNIYLPDCLYQAMSKGINVLLYADLDTRITRLIAEYQDLNAENNNEIILCMKALSKRFGSKKMEKLIEDFTRGEIHSVVGTLLVDYYDPLYGYDNADKTTYQITINSNDLEQASLQLINYLEGLRR